MPLLFAPTIGAALASRHHFLWVYCPACRTTETLTCRSSIATAMPRSLGRVDKPIDAENRKLIQSLLFAEGSLDSRTDDRR